MSLNDLLKQTNSYPSNRIISGVQDKADPNLVNDIYKTENRLIGNESKRIYGKFSPNINEYTYTNPITHRQETIRGGINYYRGDDDRVNKSLTWQKIPSYQVSNDSINFINRINHYGNNEQNRERIQATIRELNRKLAKKEITFEAYQAQKQLLESQQETFMNRTKNEFLENDVLWSSQNKTSLWKMFRAIRNLEWENDYVLDQVNSCLASQQIQTDTVNQSTQQISSAIETFTEDINSLTRRVENIETEINDLKALL